jgi:hypothetical protein
VERQRHFTTVPRIRLPSRLGSHDASTSDLSCAAEAAIGPCVTHSVAVAFGRRCTAPAEKNSGLQLEGHDDERLMKTASIADLEHAPSPAFIPRYLYFLVVLRVLRVPIS